MIILQSQSTPMWTDIIQAIGAGLSAPITLWGVYQLFIKDKDKERKISALENLANSQNAVVNKLQGQIDQLTSQTAQFQYQSTLMLEQNKILEKQFELQTSIFHHEKNTDELKIQFENQKRMSAIKPHLVFKTINSSPDNFSIKLINNGEEAKNILYKSIDTSFVFLYNIPGNLIIEKGQEFEINGFPQPTVTHLNGNQVTFELNLEFEDCDGNKYFQNLKRSRNGNVEVKPPILIIS